MGTVSVQTGRRAVCAAGEAANRAGSEEKAGESEACAVVCAVGQRGGEKAAGGGSGGGVLDVQLHRGAHEDDESRCMEMFDRGELLAERVRLSDSNGEKYVRIPGEASQ